MREWLLNAPQWVLSLIMGVPFGASMALAAGLRGDGWQQALIIGVFGAVFFGLIMGRFVHRQYGRHRDAVGGLPAQAAKAASRATWRGPVPEDPEIRAAALRLIDHQLAQARRWRTFQLVVFIGALALYVTLSIVRSPWWWAGAAFFAAMYAITVLLPRRLERRAEQLRIGLES